MVQPLWKAPFDDADEDMIMEALRCADIRHRTLEKCTTFRDLCRYCAFLLQMLNIEAERREQDNDETAVVAAEHQPPRTLTEAISNRIQQVKLTSTARAEQAVSATLKTPLPNGVLTTMCVKLVEDRDDICALVKHLWVTALCLGEGYQQPVRDESGRRNRTMTQPEFRRVFATIVRIVCGDGIMKEDVTVATRNEWRSVAHSRNHISYKEFKAKLLDTALLWCSNGFVIAVPAAAHVREMLTAAIPAVEHAVMSEVPQGSLLPKLEVPNVQLTGSPSASRKAPFPLSQASTIDNINGLGLLPLIPQRPDAHGMNPNSPPKPALEFTLDNAKGLSAPRPPNHRMPQRSPRKETPRRMNLSVRQVDTFVPLTRNLSDGCATAVPKGPEFAKRIRMAEMYPTAPKGQGHFPGVSDLGEAAAQH